VGAAAGADRQLQLVLFLLAGGRHAVMLDAVERVVAMVAVSPLPNAPPITMGVINVGGAIVPVFDLRPRLGLSPSAYDLAAHLLLARSPRRRLALATDRVLGVTEVSADVLASAAAASAGRGLAGIVAMPDGLVLIHDLERCLSDEDDARLTRALEAHER
jgi:purine-binding chemotaxis protein CheW